MRTEDVEDLDGLLVTKCPLSSSSCLGMEGEQVEQDLTRPSKSVSYQSL